MNDDMKLPTIDRRRLLKSGLAGLAGSASVALLPSEVGVAMAAARDKATAVFTLGHYEPTQVELTSGRLEVLGSIPPVLSGRYIRNGHNPRPDLVPPY
jgi:hypothetical protein